VGWDDPRSRPALDALAKFENALCATYAGDEDVGGSTSGRGIGDRPWVRAMPSSFLSRCLQR
jgi:hypothetical protein